MNDERKSDHSRKKPQLSDGQQHAIRRNMIVAAIVCLLAGSAIYSFISHNRTNPELPDQTDTPQTVATEESVDRWQLSEFVGSQKCSECHSEIAESYSEHPMAHTLALVDEASPIEAVKEGSAEFESHGCSYRVNRDGDRMIHTELMTDADGDLVYEQSEEVKYAVGSGANARTYLIDRGGLLFESPISWYVDKQKWDLSPGYEDNPRQRFNRRAIDGCLQCHSGRVAPIGDGTSNRFEEHPFPEMGIGCERCHGPGRHHVEIMESGDWDVGDDMLIVNPAQLDHHLQESVCYQCHMNGKRRILRKGKSFHDFQPGMATEDIWTTFVAPAPFESDGTTPFSSQAEQMHASACFQGSDGRMSCTTCHDPHVSPSPGEQAAFYRERCNSCHTDHGCSVPIEERELPPAHNSCIHCHMPSSGSSDIPHASQSDHRVLRDPGNDPNGNQPAIQNGIWSIFDDSEQRLPKWELDRARALALSDQAVENVDQQLIGQAIVALEAVVARDSSDVEAWRSLGFLYGLGRHHAKAASSFEAALKADPQDEISLKNLGLMSSRIGALRKGIRSYEAYLKINKWDSTMFAPYVFMLVASGDVQNAVKAAEYGLQLDPTDRELRRITSQLYSKIGDQKKSQQHAATLKEISTQLDPWDQKRRDRIKKKMQQSLEKNRPE